MKLFLTTIILVVASINYAQVSAASETRRGDATIDWKSYNSAVEKFKSQERMTRAASFSDEISKTELPVLMAPLDAVRAAPDFQTQGTSYAAHYEIPEMSIAILGSATHIISSSPGEKTASYSKPKFEINDDVSDLSFMRYGAMYTIRASCKREDDIRCRHPQFLTKFMETLIPVKRSP